MLKYMLIPRIVHLRQILLRHRQNAPPIVPSAEPVTGEMILVMTTPEHSGAIFWSFSSLKLMGRFLFQPVNKEDTRRPHLSPLGYHPSGLWNYVKDRVSVSSNKTYFVLPGQESLKGRVVRRTFTPAENLA